MNKLLLLLMILPLLSFADDCPPSQSEVCNYSNGTFYHLDNNFGLSLLGTYNQSILSNNGEGSTTGFAGGAEARLDLLTQSGFWISNTLDYVNYFGTPNYATDQANYTFKFGYGFQPIYDYWEITPYIVGSAGAGNETWDSQINFGVGAGLRTEVAIITRNSIYADYNMQYLVDGGNFANSYNQQFNTNNAFLNSIPYAQNIELGYKHIFDCETSLEVFYRYSSSLMTFSFGGNSLGQNYINQTQMIGVGINWYL